MLRLVLILFVLLSPALGQTVQEIAMPKLPLYIASETQYDRTLTDGYRAYLNQFTPHIDLFGQPLRYNLTVRDLNSIEAKA